MAVVPANGHHLLQPKQQRVAQLIMAACFFLSILVAPSLTVLYFLMQTTNNGFSFSADTPIEQFNWHPVLMVLGFNTFMMGGASLRPPPNSHRHPPPATPLPPPPSATRHATPLPPTQSLCAAGVCCHSTSFSH